MIIENKYGLGITNTIKLKDKIKTKKEKKNSLSKTKIENRHNVKIEKKNNEITITAEHKIPEVIIIERIFAENSDNKLTINAKNNSSISVFIELKGNPDVAHNTIEIIAEENSVINCYELNLLGSKTTLISKKTGITKKDAEINFMSCDLGAKIIFSETKTILEGIKSSTKIINIYHSDKNQIYDIKQEAEHANQNTNSDIKAKGTLKNSNTFVRGLIQINENAQNSNGYQKSDALLLKNSRIVSIPDLLIHNDKVKCSHGSTISRLDQEKVFYMMSRGLSEQESEIQLITGFFEPIIAEIKNNEILPRFLGAILSKVNK